MDYFHKLTRTELEQRFFIDFLRRLKVFAVLLIMLSLQRFLLFLLIRQDLPGFIGLKGIILFGTGVRFDLLILGFIGLPWAFLWGLQWLTSYHFSFQWSMIYTRVLAIALWALGLCDIAFFWSYRQHMYWSDHRKGEHFHNIVDLFYSKDPVTVSLLLVLWLMILLAVLKRSHQFEAQSVGSLGRGQGLLKDWKLRLFYVFVPLLILFLAARGTLTAHHLERSHSLLFKSHLANELILSPAWTLDKERP